MDYVSQVFLVEQINFHRKMSEKLLELYHDCWPSQESNIGGNIVWIKQKSSFKLQLLPKSFCLSMIGSQLCFQIMFYRECIL